MDIQTTNQILNKYGFSKPELILHYAAISGEIPTTLIRNLDINENLQRYYIYKSKFFKGKNYLISKTNNHLYGYQLSLKGKRYLLENKKDYIPYLLSAQDTRKTTNDLYKRLRYRNTAFLYYFFDKLNIEYFFYHNKEMDSFFYSSVFLKKLFHIEETQADTEFEIIGSKFFGALKLNKEYYLTYVFGNSISTLSYNMEQRAKIIIENYYNLEDSGTILFFYNYCDLEKSIISIFNSIISDNKEYNNKQFKFFRQLEQTDYSKFLFCSLDSIGIQLFSYIKDSPALYKKIKDKIYSYEHNTNELEANRYYNADFIISGSPAVILSDFDLCKIIDVYNRIHYNDEQNMFYKIICFRSQYNVYKKLFSPISDFISFLIIENILDNL